MTEHLSAAPSPARTRSWRIAVLVPALIGLAIFGFFCVKHGHWSYSSDVRPGKEGSDFTAFYSAGELARQGRNLYDFTSSSTPRRPFIYPPLFALIPMVPLSLLSHDAAHAVFYALNMALLLAGCCVLARWLWPRAPASFWRSPEFGLLLTAAICWRFIHASSFEGNTNLIIFGLLVFGLHAALRSLQSPPAKFGFLSGLTVALATVFKLTPGLFGIYFLWSRNVWAMVGGALGLIVFLFVIPSTWLGWETNTRYVRAFSEVTLRKAQGKGLEPGANTAQGITIGWPKEPDPATSDNAVGLGVSLRAPIMNLSTPTVALKKRDGAGSRTVNLVALDPALAQRISTLAALALLLTTIALTFPRRVHTTVCGEALCWSLVAVTMVLISPMTRVAHLVVLLLPAAVLMALLQRSLLSGNTRRCAWFALILLGAGGIIVSRGILGEHLAEAANAMGFTTVCVLVLYVAVAVALVRNGGGSELTPPAAP